MENRKKRLSVLNKMAPREPVEVSKKPSPEDPYAVYLKLE